MLHLDEAIAFLSQDPVLSPVILQQPKPIWQEDPNLYEHLIGSIVGQQLSDKAATTIFNRFKALFPTSFPSPQEVLDMNPDLIRGAGLSYSKIAYIKSLCNEIILGNLVLERLEMLPDEEVITQLTRVKGIGRWTAEMTLIFSLKRPDIFSIGDLGLRTAVSKLFKVPREDLKTITEISMKWSPYRSVASRYLWMSLDNSTVPEAIVEQK